MHTATTKYEGAVAKLTLVFKAVTASSGLLRLSQCSRTNSNKRREETTLPLLFLNNKKRNHGPVFCTLFFAPHILDLWTN